MWRAWVALSATTATNPRGGRANVKRISSYTISIFHIHWWNIFENISSVLPGCVAFARNHSSEAAGAWKGRRKMERGRGRTRSAPALGRHLRVAEDILDIVIFSWDNFSPSPSKMIWWVGFENLMFEIHKGEHCPLPLLSWDGADGRGECADPQRGWHLPRAGGAACQQVIYPSLLLICIPTIWCKTFREEVEMEASENAPIG